jgi:hypothetical protein
MLEPYFRLESEVVAPSETAVSPHQTANCHRNLQPRNSNNGITFNGILVLVWVGGKIETNEMGRACGAYGEE